MTLHMYWATGCARCALKEQCTTGKHRRITRWEHEAVLDAMQHRLDREPEMTACGGRRSSTRSGRSNTGWVPPIS